MDQKAKKIVSEKDRKLLQKKLFSFSRNKKKTRFGELRALNLIRGILLLVKSHISNNVVAMCNLDI